MKKINTAVATAVALMMGTATTTWAGVAGPPGPAIDDAGYTACWVLDSNGNPQHISGGNVQVLHSVEAGSGNVNSVCTGENYWLVHDYTGKRALTFGPDEWGNPPCFITYEDEWGWEHTVPAANWHQTLTNTGNFALECHFQPGDDVD